MEQEAVEVRVEKGFTIRLPEELVKALGIREGDVGSARVEEARLIIDFTRDPLELALHGPKFASLKPEEIEAISLEEQRKRIESAP